MSAKFLAACKNDQTGEYCLMMEKENEFFLTKELAERLIKISKATDKRDNESHSYKIIEVDF